MDPQIVGGETLSEFRCPECNTVKPLTEDFWRPVTGSAQGDFVKKRCRACEDAKRVRSLKPEVQEAINLRDVADRGLKPTAVAAMLTDPAATVAAARERARIARAKDKALASTDPRRASTRLSTLLAVQGAAKVINREAGAIMELLAGYAMDPTSPHHEFAMKEFIERIIPRKAFTALAIKEAGLEEAAGKTAPQITINVVGGPPPVLTSDGQHATIDVTPVPTEE